MRKHRESRRPDSGTITIISIFMLIALMAMAGLAVDLGFLYTRSRMIYAVADSAVAVGMKDLMAGKSSSVITGDIGDIAGKYGGAYTIDATTTPPTATTVTVSVSRDVSALLRQDARIPVEDADREGRRHEATLRAPPILALGNGCGVGA